MNGWPWKLLWPRRRARGREPVDVSQAKCGYDIESRHPDNSGLFFIEVKGRAEGAPTVTITRNEILTAFNKPDEFRFIRLKRTWFRE